jgi:ribosomal protein S8
MGEIFTSELHDKIVKIVAQYGYITVNEAAMITGDMKHAYNVLKYLYSKGTLRTFPTHLMPTKGYYLPDDMKKVIETKGAVSHVENFYPYSFRQSGLYHHTSLIQTHLMIDKVFGEKLLEYIPEPCLKRDSGKKKVCDGEFHYLTNNNERKRAGIEVELTLKNAESRRIQAKSLSDYANDNLNFILVFYNQSIVKQRTAEALKQCGKLIIPVFFLNLPDFLKNGDATEGETLNGEKRRMFKKEA